MYIEDTIVAPATPAGNGAIAIIRLSGPKAAEILGGIWKPLRRAQREPRHLYLGEIVDPDTGAILDRAIAVEFPKPHSLTGEDVVELQCHGGSYLVRRIVGLAMRLGARMAEPGEFMRRAFLNGRVDLTEAEAVADLIEARSDTALVQAASQLNGLLASKLHGLREDLIGIRAHLEAEIDFSEEGLQIPSRCEIASAVERVSSDVALLHDSYERGRLIREGVRLAIVGRPNVGKSSIMNLMLGSDRAIVTPIPGTTRDIIEDSIRLGPYAMVLQDTAGVRHSDDEIERLGIARTWRVADEADLVMMVFDMSQPLDKNDVAIVHQMRNRAYLTVLNKSDLAPRTGLEDLRSLGVLGAVLPFCALKVDGIEALRGELVKAIESLSGPPHGAELAISRERHREALARALEALAAAKESALKSMPPEIIAVDIVAAADALGQITGEVHTEDVLDAVFREFCIGK